MNKPHFQTQIDRLLDRFGASNSKMISFIQRLWQDVKDFDDRWITRQVDEFIYTARQLPLGNEWRTEISLERERLYQLQKQTQSQDAWDAKRNLDEFLCTDCMNKGFIIDSTNTVWRCHCKWGKLKNLKWPIYQRE